LRNVWLQTVINHVQDFGGFENFVGAANVIGMRMGGDKVVELLDVVTFQRFNDNFAFARVARVDQNRLAARRDDQNGVAFDGPNIKHVNLKLATGRRRRSQFPARPNIFPPQQASGAKHNHQNRNRAPATFKSSPHSTKSRIQSRH
jgi:hypothetical protein